MQIKFVLMLVRLKLYYLSLKKKQQIVSDLLLVIYDTQKYYTEDYTLQTK